MLLSPEKRLNIYLSFWINDPSKLISKSSGKSKKEKLALKEEYKQIVAVKRKLVEAFKLRRGETDVFVVAILGKRFSYPNCLTEQILTLTEIEILEIDDEEDSVLEMFSEGYYTALETIVNNA